MYHLLMRLLWPRLELDGHNPDQILHLEITNHSLLELYFPSRSVKHAATRTNIRDPLHTVFFIPVHLTEPMVSQIRIIVAKLQAS